MKNIQIIDRSFGQIIAEFPMFEELIENSEQSSLEDAWDIAVKENLVDENFRENYAIEIIGSS